MLACPRRFYTSSSVLRSSRPSSRQTSSPPSVPWSTCARGCHLASDPQSPTGLALVPHILSYGVFGRPVNARAGVFREGEARQQVHVEKDRAHRRVGGAAARSADDGTHPVLFGLALRRAAGERQDPPPQQARPEPRHDESCRAEALVRRRDPAQGPPLRTGVRNTGGGGAGRRGRLRYSAAVRRGGGLAQERARRGAGDGRGEG